MAKKVTQKEINFLEVLAGRRGKSKINPKSLIMPGVLLLILLAGLGAFGFFSTQTAEVNRESREIKEYLNSPETARQMQEASNVESEANQMNSQAERVAAPMVLLATYPDLSSADYSRILGAAGVNIEISSMSYDRSTGVLRFLASSDYVLSIPTFIAHLRQTGIFSHVSYSGYASTVQPGNPIIQATTTYLDMGGASYGLYLDSMGTSSDPSDYYSGGTTGGTAGGSSGGTTGGTSGGSQAVTSAPLFSFSVECIVKPPDTSAQSRSTADQSA